MSQFGCHNPLGLWIMIMIMMAAGIFRKRSGHAQMSRCPTLTSGAVQKPIWLSSSHRATRTPSSLPYNAGLWCIRLSGCRLWLLWNNYFEWLRVRLFTPELCCRAKGLYKSWFLQIVCILGVIAVFSDSRRTGLWTDCHILCGIFGLDSLLIWLLRGMKFICL